MSIWDLCIRRPVFTVMLSAVPIILGIAAYGRLGVEQLPNVDVPYVTVTTTLRGASAEEMETAVTKPIEEAVNTISGIDELRSTTREGMSQVVVSFKIEKPGTVAAQEVQAKIQTVLGRLPAGTDPPVVDRLALDATPVLTIAVSGRRDIREVTELARKRLKETLETVDGVGAVTLVGGRTRAVNVILDPDRLLKYENLTVEDVRQALIRENREDPGGRVDQGETELVLRTVGRVRSAADFADLIVTNRSGQPVRIRDLGKVEDTVEEPRGLSRLWSKGDGETDARPGENAVSLVVQKQSGSNTVRVARAVKARLDELRGALPGDVRAVVIRDQSRFIEASMHEVQVHLLLAAVLVSGSILLFLRDWRTTLIATVSIPTSLVGTFAFMNAMGFTINDFTMLGLILAVGIVVDDAVVVHENIFRHMEEKGLSAWEAASGATREIALAVVATTLSLVVIFAPIAFMGGTVGRFLSSFGYVVGFSVLMSMVVSFTLTPMLCARFLKAEDGHKSSKSGVVWRLVEGAYVGLLAWSLRNRWAVVVVSVGFLALTPGLFAVVGFDFVPKDDAGEFEVAITLPEGYTLDRADRVLAEVESKIRRLRGVTGTFVTIGDTSGRAAKGQGDVTKATVYVRLTDLEQRDFAQKAVMADARAALTDYPELRSTVQDVATAGEATKPVDVNITGPDQARLQAYAADLTRWMKDRGGYADVDTNLSLRKPEFRVVPDRERLSDLGVSLASVASTTGTLVGGEPVTRYKEGDEQYDVWLRADLKGRSTPEAIARMGIPAAKASGGVVQLESVVRLEPGTGPNAIERYARQRQVAVRANLQGKDLSTAVAEMTAKLQEMNLPPEYRFEFFGDAKLLKESNENFALGFLLAFVFMYMILAAQFESFVHPVSILLALPLTIPFAVLSLVLLRTPLDVYGMLGLFMLFGIVKKNGILQVDYTNQLRAQGLGRDEAILEANRVRLRPILMTTVMLVAAMVPMAIGQGPGAGTRASMAKVILGGQSLSLLLTLLVTPVAYSLFDGAAGWVRGLRRRSGHERPGRGRQPECRSGDTPPGDDRYRV